MLKDQMKLLIDQLRIGKKFIYSPNPDSYIISFKEDMKISFNKVDEGIYLHSVIAPMPQDANKEVLFSEMLYNDLFNQGTFGATIGLSEDSKEFTLSRLIADDLSYNEFYEAAEDFLNTLMYWREHIKEIK